MQEIQLSVEMEPSATDLAALGKGLTEHALPFTGVPGFRPLAVFARDADGNLVGGASGLLNWTWLHVALLWVSAEHRDQGLGSRLLGAIEAAAAERGCTRAHLDTFSYQAKPFYERHGYRVFAVLHDYPPGHQRIFLNKRLRNAAPENGHDAGRESGG